jgi:hypothetical protein
MRDGIGWADENGGGRTPGFVQPDGPVRRPVATLRQCRPLSVMAACGYPESTMAVGPASNRGAAADGPCL